MFKKASAAIKRKRRFMRILSVSVAFVMSLSACTVPVFGLTFVENILSKYISAASPDAASGGDAGSNAKTSSNSSSNYIVVNPITRSNNFRAEEKPDLSASKNQTADTQTTEPSNSPQSTATNLSAESSSIFEESQNFSNNPNSTNFVPTESSGNSNVTSSASSGTSPNSNSTSAAANGSSAAANIAPIGSNSTSTDSNNLPGSDATQSGSNVTQINTNGASADRIQTSTVSNNKSGSDTAQTFSNDIKAASDSTQVSTNGAQNAAKTESKASQPGSSDAQSDSSNTQTDSNSIQTEPTTTSNAPPPRISLRANLQNFDAVFLSAFVLDDVIDVDDKDWFRYAVIWAYQTGIMQGTSASTFSPNAPLTTAMVVSTLARIQNIDLSAYSSDDDDWFSAACGWAEQSAVFDEIGEIDQETLIDRGQMALILVKVLDSLDVSLETTGASIVFADRSLMSDKENEAFQLLCTLGIFKGVGDLRMAPRETLTRAELAFIMYNIRDYFKHKYYDISSRRAQAAAIYHRYARGMPDLKTWLSAR